MEKIGLTCVECPMGCSIEVTLENGRAVEVKGNGCPRGKLYAENEVVCPKRVVTTTVRTTDGRMLPVKTDKPIRRSRTFEVMSVVNGFIATAPVKIGDVLIKNVDEDADLVATADLD